MQVWMIFAAILALIGFGFFIGGWLVQYSIEFWASRFGNKEVDASYLLCCIAGVFVGWNIAIPIALLTWVYDLAT